MLIEQEKSETQAGLMLTPDDLARLQWEQFEHDEKYHHEIARLTVQDRLKHMALHFAKYSGGLAAQPEETELRRLVTDIFVIALSSANILKIRLADRHNELLAEAPGDLRTAVAMSAGRMAAACEKMDHLEAFPFREKIDQAIFELMRTSISFAAERDWDMVEMVRARLQPVKEKNPFYGKL